MNKYTVKIRGMMCSMCEAHIVDTIRRAFPGAQKVKASKSRGEATFLLKGVLNEQKLKKAVDDTGYTAGEVSAEPYAKRGLFKR